MKDETYSYEIGNAKNANTLFGSIEAVLDNAELSVSFPNAESNGITENMTLELDYYGGRHSVRPFFATADYVNAKLPLESNEKVKYRGVHCNVLTFFIIYVKNS